MSALRASTRPAGAGLAQDLPFGASKGHLEQSAKRCAETLAADVAAAKALVA